MPGGGILPPLVNLKMMVVRPHRRRCYEAPLGSVYVRSRVLVSWGLAALPFGRCSC